MGIEERVERYEKLFQNLVELSGEDFGRDQKLLIISALRKAYSENKLVKLLRKWDLITDINDLDQVLKEVIDTLYSLMKEGLDLNDDEAGEAILYVFNLRKTLPRSLVGKREL
ncbi:MAG: hypothetical protein GXO26_10240 [Crenarchaeota archaeon]|nr:hypothetical protein [Thermoproteota archaeon]